MERNDAAVTDSSPPVAEERSDERDGR